MGRYAFGLARRSRAEFSGGITFRAAKDFQRFLDHAGGSVVRPISPVDA
jgi:hypothetical protein